MDFEDLFNQMVELKGKSQEALEEYTTYLEESEKVGNPRWSNIKRTIFSFRLFFETPRYIAVEVDLNEDLIISIYEIWKTKNANNRWSVKRNPLRKQGKQVAPSSFEGYIPKIVEAASTRRYKSGCTLTDYTLGMVYILKFSTGVIKVGKSNCYNVDNRVNEQINIAEALGIQCLDFWVSDVTKNYESAERAMISHCAKRCETRARSEYFTGMNFDDVVSFAKTVV